MPAHEVQVRVRYAETDKMGLVYYGNYFTYFEVGRTDLLRRVGMPYSQLEAEGIYFPVVDAQCKYLGAARYEDLLTVRTWISNVRRTRLEFSYEIRRDGDQALVATGATTLVCMNKDFKPIEIPERLRELVTAELGGCGNHGPACTR